MRAHVTTLACPAAGLAGCKVCTHQPVVVQIRASESGEPAAGVCVRTEEAGLAQLRLQRDEVPGGVAVSRAPPRGWIDGAEHHWLPARRADTADLTEMLEPWPDGDPAVLLDLAPHEQRWEREHSETKHGARAHDFEVLLWRE